MCLKNRRGKKREGSGHLCIVNVFYLYFHVYLMITYIEILHLCSFSVATEPSAEQPWLRTDQTAALSLYRQVQISRPQPVSNVSWEHQRHPGSEPHRRCPPLENTHRSPGGRRSTSLRSAQRLLFRAQVGGNLWWSAVWLLDKMHRLVIKLLVQEVRVHKNTLFTSCFFNTCQRTFPPWHLVNLHLKTRTK